jgi:hypothetical protein
MHPELCAPTSPAPVGRPKRQHTRADSGFDKKLGQLPVGVRRTQDWLRLRFEKVMPEDFCDGGVIFYTAQLLEAPAGFESVWGGAINARHRAGGPATEREREVITAAPAVVLLADLFDKEQMKSVISMGEFINGNFGDAAPLLIYAPHSVCDELRKPNDLADSLALMMNVLDCGIDEAITGEPEGMKLVLEVQNKVFVQASLIDKFNDKPDSSEEDAAERAKKVEFLEEVVHDIIWDYLRVRLDSNVPAIDWSIAPGMPHQIEDYRVGSFLGKGSFGSVYKLEFADGDPEPTGSVLKTIAKQRMSDMSSLYNVKKQIKVMQILSEEFPHPNITKLQRVYHTETHLLFQLEDCGPLDLYRYYLQCEKRQSPLSRTKTHSIIQQLISGVCHMHTKPKVVHCDLKPENIIITESGNTVLIKISDFDTAQVDPEVPSYGVAGTFPFSAPEIVLEKKFDPYAADIWSLGLVIVELLCFSQVLETALQLDSGNKLESKEEKYQVRKRMMTKIRDFFSQKEAVGCLLQENMRHDLQDMMTHSFLLLLRSMLNVSGADRLRAERLMQAI